MLPDFYIIGAQKSGTTFLHKCLSEHPDIFMPKGESPHFEKPIYSKVAISELKKILLEGSRRKLRGIKRPNYLCCPESPMLIFKHTPKAKLIVILRNPVERAISSYFHFMRMGLAPIENPETGIKNVLIKGSIVDYPRSKEILLNGKYSTGLKRYLKYFSKNKIHIIFYKDLKVNPKKVIRNCYKFLKVNPAFIPKSIDKIVFKGAYSLNRIRFIRLEAPFLYMNKSRSGITPKKRGLLDKVILKILFAIDRFVIKPIFGNQNKEISENLKKEIYKYYESEIASLEKLLNVDLSHWKIA